MNEQGAGGGRPNMDLPPTGCSAFSSLVRKYAMENADNKKLG
jgi:hypothetical protein